MKFIQLDFSNPTFQKSSADQYGVQLFANFLAQSRQNVNDQEKIL